MTSPKFHCLFGGPPRDPESPITRREMDLAASIQFVAEEVMLRAARYVHGKTGLPNLVMAGGVAFNCVGNGRILREGPFERLWIQPAAGDAGGALGAALFIWHQLLQSPRKISAPDSQKGSLLGPSYTDDRIASCLKSLGAVYTTYGTTESLCDEVASLLAEEKVVGWFQGRMEFGARALGARSILGDPRSPKMQSVMNMRIKFRESFRPFAPAVLREFVDAYFEMRPGEDCPYMLLVAPVHERVRTPLNLSDEKSFDLSKHNVPRSAVPAITHVDYSARVQTVDPQRNPLFYRLVRSFHARTGCPVLINTSFNVRDEPIVCTPEDAYRCFRLTDMDALALGRHLLLKEKQYEVPVQERADYLANFKLD